MANYNVSVTQSIEAQPANISAGEVTTYTISNPLIGSSYFTLETARNSNGFYDSTSPKNTSGSFSLGTGITGLIQSDYIASAIVAPGGGILTFTPAVNITNTSLYLRGVGSNEGNVFPPVPPTPILPIPVFGTGFNNTVNIIKTQSDEKILIGGLFTVYNNVSSSRITKLNSDGSIDNTFTIGTGFDNSTTTIQIQSDGKTLVGGAFTSYNGTTSNRIIRLNSDGSNDNTFITGTGFGSTVNTIALQSDGKTLVGGLFTSYNGTTSNRIIRLNSDGSIDNTFSIGTGFNNPVNIIAIQSDGKILVGGLFTSYNGTTSNRIIRLNSDGSIDNTFITGTGFNNAIQIIQIQSDGKTLVGGAFTSYNGTTSNRIIRLNSDGSIDNTFSIGTGFNFNVNAIQIQSDGKILAGGTFGSYNGTTSNRIIRLNSDGSIDNTFITGTGFNNTVNTIQTRSDNKILIGGNFTTYNSLSSEKIILLDTNGTKIA
jgi:uncharacterized delta-60 repeat protein